MTLTEYANHCSIKLTGPQTNLLTKLDAMGVSIFSPDARPLTVNPVSRYSENMDPLLSALINWVYEVYSTQNFVGPMNYRGTKVAIATFDRVRYLVLALDAKAFSNFID